MKKLFAAIFAALMITTAFAGCSDPLVNRTETTAATSEGETVAEQDDEVKADSYKDSLEGLRDYLKELGYITIEDNNSNVTEMKADLIGAEEGYKYTTGTVTVEIYSFKLSGNNPTRDSVIASVKNSGSFELYEKTVENVFLSDNGKYLMIYSDTAIASGDTSGAAYKKMQDCIEAFKGFYA